MSSEQLSSIDVREKEANCDAVWGGDSEYMASNNPSSKNDMQPFVNLP